MGTAQSPSSPAYLRAARFKTKEEAKRVYNQVQEAIYQAECDLSVYNLALNGEPTVVVLGDALPAELDEQLKTLLSFGTVANLPLAVIRMLTERSIEERGKGPWSEGHYGTGKRLI